MALSTIERAWVSALGNMLKEKGAIYALIAMSFNVVSNSSGILNFANGAILVVAGVIAYVVLPAQPDAGPRRTAVVVLCERGRGHDEDESAGGERGLAERRCAQQSVLPCCAAAAPVAPHGPLCAYLPSTCIAVPRRRSCAGCVRSTRSSSTT